MNAARIVLFTTTTSLWTNPVLRAFLSNRKVDVIAAFAQPDLAWEIACDVPRMETSLELCREHGAAFSYNQDANAHQFIEQLIALVPDYVFAFGYGQIFKKPIITAFQGRFFNIHPAFLPDHKGPNPFQSSLMEGEQETGFAIHEVSQSVDDGDIVYRQKVPISTDDDALSLMARVGLACAKSLDPFIDLMLGGKLQRIPNKDGNGYFAKYGPEDFVLRPDDSWEKVQRKIRAGHGGPGLRILLNNCSIRAEKVVKIERDMIPPTIQTGTVYDRSEEAFSIVMPDHLLCVTLFSLEDKDTAFDAAALCKSSLLPGACFV